MYISIQDILLGDDDEKDIPVNIGELPVAKLVKGRYLSPWTTKTKKNPLAVFQWILTRKQNVLPFPSGVVRPVDVIERVELNEERIEKTNHMHFTWLGHASCYFQTGGKYFLTDPVFSERASPFQFAGPKRILSPSFNIQKVLRHLDVVLLSHTHYDHLDYGTAMQIGNRALWVVPLGVKELLAGWGITNCVELNWWGKHTIAGDSASGDVEIVFTPTKHWTSRTPFDRNTCLWGSFVVGSEQGRVFFGGDTSYCDVFKQIGELYGPFDVSALSIGAYKPRWFMKHVHCNPEEAVKIHKELKSKRSVGIHWGTFPLADEDDIEPALELARARQAEGVPAQDFFTMGIGETVSITAADATQPQSIHWANDIATKRPDLYENYVSYYGTAPKEE